MFVARRFADNPLISVASHPGLDGNVNGPSIIKAPLWLPRRLGRYYMYFAHHQGTYIRLATADDLEGPWRLHEPGTLRLDQTPCHGHIASPDVHVDAARRRLLMYFHGPLLTPREAQADPLTQRFPYLGGQRSLLATSPDGLNFTSDSRILGPSYYRVFSWRGGHYALAMPGLLYRRVGEDAAHFQEGPLLFGPECRHFAVHAGQDALHVFFTRAGDAPERIFRTPLRTEGPWTEWSAGPEKEVLRPELPYEGSELPLMPSLRGAVHEPARQLRDPCIFAEGERLYLFYAIAGEQGIAGAELVRG